MEFGIIVIKFACKNKNITGQFFEPDALKMPTLIDCNHKHDATTENHNKRPSMLILPRAHSSDRIPAGGNGKHETFMKGTY